MARGTSSAAALLAFALAAPAEAAPRHPEGPSSRPRHPEGPFPPAGPKDPVAAATGSFAIDGQEPIAQDDGEEFSLPLGPFRLVPRFRLGTLGLDSNVFYTATDRRADLTASGGPGADLVLPFAGLGRATVGGDLDYTFFWRTASQRRLAGGALAGVEWRGERLAGSAAEAFRRSYGRPSPEVDERLVQDEWATRLEARFRTPARLAVRGAFEALDADVPEGSAFRGAPLSVTLTHDTDRLLLGFAYALTPKTAALLEADDQNDRFPKDPTRDADSNRAYAGVRIESETRLAGRAVAGLRSFRPRDPARGASRALFYASAELAYAVGPRTRLSAAFQRDLAFSAYDGPGPVTLTQSAWTLGAEKGLVGRFDLRLSASRVAFRSDGPLSIEEAGRAGLVERSDAVWELGADLGYLFASRLRAGVAVVWSRRRSNVADLGVSGLLLGGTLSYNPRRP
jgi:hypothetical protein